MSIKIKISIIAICFALVAAVCVGFVFAAPNETITMNGTLSYEVAKATISVSPNISTLGSTTGSGSTTGLSPGTGSGEYVIGDTVTLTATIKSGSTFLAWATSTDPNEMKILSTSRTYSFELTEDSPTTYFALFNRTTSTSQTVGDLEYTIYEDAKLAEVTDTTSTTLSSAEIPSVVSSGENSYKVYSIGSSAFQYCYRLTSISIPEGLTEIGNYAFFSCSKLTSITIPEGVTSIGYHAFNGCSSLTSITIPEGVTKISTQVFYGCSNLTSITIPEGVISINAEAFYGCSSLTSITIPEGVTSIGSSAFAYCSSLEAFNGKGNSYYKIVDDSRALLVDGGKTLLAYAIANTATSYTIPKGVTSIGDKAFYWCSSLTEITIPEGVTKIGIQSFSNCSSLTEITIPEGLTSIGASCFLRCTNLESIILPETLTTINNNAFQNCVSLESIILPNSIRTVNGSAFDLCSGLKEIKICGNITTFRTTVFSDCPNIEKLVISSNVTALPSSLFTNSNLTNLTEIVVEEGSTLSAALPTYATWYKDDDPTEVKNFSGAGTYSTTKPA